MRRCTIGDSDGGEGCGEPVLSTNDARLCGSGSLYCIADASIAATARVMLCYIGLSMSYCRINRGTYSL